MSLRLGDIAPNFTAQTTEGEFDFHQWLGTGWGVLFSHPADFTPVCTTELGSVATIKEEFTKRNVKVLAVSVDPLESHHRWLKDINERLSRPMHEIAHVVRVDPGNHVVEPSRGRGEAIDHCRCDVADPLDA